MNPMQQMVMREFKDLNNKLDNILIDSIIPQITAYFEELGTTSYNKVIKDSNEIKEMLRCKYNKDEIDTKRNKVETLLSELIDYIGYYFTLGFIDSKEFHIILNDCIELVTPVMDEMMLLSASCKIFNNKVGLQTFFKMKKAFNELPKLINLAMFEIMEPYLFYIEDEVSNLSSFIFKYEQKINPLDKIREIKNNYKIENIYNYKELNRKLEKLGFKYVRQTGDHRIFKNNNGNSLSVPQHTLGKGLSRKIQKNAQQQNKL